MQIVRTLHINKYNIHKGRFQTDAFSNYHGGISVFSLECAQNKSDFVGVCEHIAKYYQTTVGDPIIYWIIDQDDIRHFYNEKYDIDIDFNNTPSASGDDCHIDIVNIPNNKTEKYFLPKCIPENIRVCDNLGISCNISSFDSFKELKEKYVANTDKI